jgi:hypothetical protein
MDVIWVVLVPFGLAGFALVLAALEDALFGGQTAAHADARHSRPGGTTRVVSGDDRAGG